MSSDFTNPHESDRIISQFRPFPFLKDAKNAAEQYTSLKISASDRRKILERLLVTDDYFKDICPTLFSSLKQLESHSVHLILDNIIRLIIAGEDFGNITSEIAKLMNDKNFNIREKATLVLTHMGEEAHSATPRILAYLRSKIPDTQLDAVKVLSAIGPICAEQALPRLKLFSNSTNNKELREACLKAIQILRGEEKPLRPEVHIEGVINTTGTRHTITDTDQADSSESHAKEYSALKNKTIVIAEDQESLRAMIRRALSSCGATIRETYDGEMVLKMLQAKVDIDLFILDLMMPSVNGCEVLKVIRSNPLYEFTPVIIISARTERSVKLRVAQYDISSYFAKPFKLTDLLGRINQIFSQD